MRKLNEVTCGRPSTLTHEQHPNRMSGRTRMSYGPIDGAYWFDFPDGEELPYRVVYAYNTQPDVWFVSCIGKDKRLTELQMTREQAIAWLQEDE